VSITNGLLKRLDPGEFLNDTLIEFGLKLWLDEIRERDPGLAERVHIFSSFFYKKLKGKSAQDGYQSIRKWTAKFDFFEKDYIIVPINEKSVQLIEISILFYHSKVFTGILRSFVTQA